MTTMHGHLYSQKKRILGALCAFFVHSVSNFSSTWYVHLFLFFSKAKPRDSSESLGREMGASSMHYCGVIPSISIH